MLLWIQKKIEQSLYNRYIKFFRVVPDIKDEWNSVNLPIEIVKGKFKGIIFEFLKIVVQDGGQITFSARILEGPEKIIANDKLYNLFRNILVCMMIDLDNGKFIQRGLKAGEEYEDREDYFEEPVTQRTVHKKKPTLSKE